jgi:hypothetical protein
VSFITKTSPITVLLPTEISTWQTPSFHITLMASNILQAMVRSWETGIIYTVDVKAPFTVKHLSRLQKTIRDHFYIHVIKSDHIPVCVEFFPRGVGGGFYSQTTIPLPSLPQGNASFSRMPQNPQELVWLLQQPRINEDQRKRYISYANDFIERFADHHTHTKEELHGLVQLVLIADKKMTLDIMEQLAQPIRNNILLNIDFVHALADAIDRAHPDFLSSDNLVDLMQTLIKRMKTTHFKREENDKREKNEREKNDFEDQLKAFVRIVNAMVDANVCEFPLHEHEEVREFLISCSKYDTSGIKNFVAYAEQAFGRVPNDESKLAYVLRHTLGIAKGIYHLYAAFNQLDPERLVKSFFEFQKPLKVVSTAIKGISLQVSTHFQEAFNQASIMIHDGKNYIRKSEWYDQIRYVEFLISSNCFCALEHLLLDDRLQKTPRFMYLLVLKLHEVILTHPDSKIKSETLALLKDIYQDDKKWSNLTLEEDHYKDGDITTALEQAKKGKFKTAAKSMISNQEKFKDRKQLKGMIISYFHHCHPLYAL